MMDQQTIGATTRRRRLRLAWRTALVVVIVGLLAGVVSRLAVPLLISTDHAKATMEKTLSSWTGATVQIDKEPEFSLWPHPELTLRSIRFTDAPADGATIQADALATADSISADLDLISLLRGEAIFSNFRLVRPVVFIEQRANKSLNWKRSGWMAEAVTSGTDAAAQASTGHQPIGDITVENGRFELVDMDGGRHRTIEAVNGTMAWPTPADAASGAFSAIFEGETFTWTFSCEEPLLLLSGHHARLETTLVSAPVTVRFEGVAGKAASVYAAGALDVRAAALPALVDHFVTGTKAALPQGAMTLSATTTLSGGLLKMDNLALDLGGAVASGVVDASWDSEGPRLGGTLAFDTLDLTTLTAPFAPMLPALENALTSGRTPLGAPRLDLRISIQKAHIPKAILTDVAAGILIDKGRVSADIGDATYSGGTLSGHAEFSAKGTQLRGALRSADLTPVIKQFGLITPLPLGKGTLSAELSSPSMPSAVSAGTLEGTLSYQANEGMVGRFDIAQLEQLSRAGTGFDAIRIADDAFPFRTADLRVTLKQGSALIDHAEIVGNTHLLSLKGSLSLSDGALALHGELVPNDRVAPGISFAVSGPWQTPVFSPLQSSPTPATPSEPTSVQD